MFIDEDTLTKIHAELNESVSSGTMRAQDLVPTFLGVIKDTPEYAQIMMSNVPELRVISDPTAEDEDWDTEFMTYFLNEELWDTMNSYAPDGYYFGAHEGDGSDYGFWRESMRLTPEDLSREGRAQYKKQGNYDFVKHWHFGILSLDKATKQAVVEEGIKVIFCYSDEEMLIDCDGPHLTDGAKSDEIWLGNTDENYIPEKYADIPSAIGRKPAYSIYGEELPNHTALYIKKIHEYKLK